MKTSQKLVVGVVLGGILVAAVVFSFGGSGARGVDVRMEEVETRDLVATVTASGNIRARRTVDISSDVSARVAQLLVGEGDDVEEGQILVRLDPSQFEAIRSRSEAALSQARAQGANTLANLTRAQRDLDRILALYQRDTLLVSLQQLEDLQTSLEVARANMDSAEFGVDQAQASLEEAEEQLDKTIIRAPIAGKVTRLNIEEGETVIIGTMNNPGSLVLTISDLAVVEAVVQVDETDVPNLSVGDSATVQLDAFPGVPFSGRITEIGNSAILPPSASGSQQTAIDFEVVITLDKPSVELRTDLSATAEIVTDTRKGVVVIPIIALTIRDREEVEGGEESGSAPRPSGDFDDVEGVFVVNEGIVSFREVTIGIAGTEYFEVLSGVSVGDSLVAGPYQIIRQLEVGDAVRHREGAIIQ